ncbi:unnamed protein product [Soboliphyme baturini]|uniref:SHSP domain-containing protein n=1 Tax=Soboliphyme baturini TaxID=241478 RepID=A0A183IJZ9_9BILA|nr:unnamed protein product [Soboliphyme baturini]
MDTEMVVGMSHDWTADLWDWPLQQDTVIRTVNTKERFEVALDAKGFRPNEIEIKCLGHELWVHCKHEQTEDSYGSIRREFHRAYHLPEDVDTSTLKSHLRRDGTLLIEAKKIA